MTIIRIFAVVCAGLGLAAAIVAAGNWWKASRVNISHLSASISDVPEQYILSTQVAFHESSHLNSRAAIWTGAAAILSAVSWVSYLEKDAFGYAEPFLSTVALRFRSPLSG